METPCGVILKFGGRIVELAYGRIGMIFPGHDASEYAAAGVADLFGCCAHALVQPGANAAAADGIVDEVLIFMHHGAVGSGGVGIIGHFACSGDCGIGINIKNGNTVVADIRRIEETCDISAAAGPTILNVVVQHMELAIAGGSVGMIAEGRLHEIELGVEFCCAGLGNGGIDGMGAAGGSRSPDVAVGTDRKALELNAAAAGGGIGPVDSEGLGGAHAVGSPGVVFGRLGLGILCFFGKLGVNIYDVIAACSNEAARGLSGACNARLDKTGHCAGGIGRARRCGGVIDNDIVAGITTGGIIINNEIAVADVFLLGDFCARHCKSRYSGHYEAEHEQETNEFFHWFLSS